MNPQSLVGLGLGGNGALIARSQLLLSVRSLRRRGARALLKATLGKEVDVLSVDGQRSPTTLGVVGCLVKMSLSGNGNWMSGVRGGMGYVCLSVVKLMRRHSCEGIERPFCVDAETSVVIRTWDLIARGGFGRILLLFLRY